MKTLDKELIISIHSQLISATGGSDGIKDDNMLESAINAPFQTFAGEEFFPTIYQKAARLGFGLVSNHPFIDGNKRIAAHAMLALLDLNDIELEYTNDELSEIFLDIANDKARYEDLLSWIIEHVIWK